MIISVENAYTGNDFRKIFSFHYKKTAEDVVREVLRSEKCPFDAEVSICIVDDDEIRRYNKETRGIDKPTDVLSFPMVDYPEPAGFSILKEGDVGAFDPANGLLMLGDIVISAAKVRDQALEYGHSAKREWAFLIAHSMLHLIGYDHMTDDDRKMMESRQEEILDTLRIKREDKR